MIRHCIRHESPLLLYATDVWKAVECLQVRKKPGHRPRDVRRHPAVVEQEFREEGGQRSRFTSSTRANSTPTMGACASSCVTSLVEPEKPKPEHKDGVGGVPHRHLPSHRHQRHPHVQRCVGQRPALPTDDPDETHPTSFPICKGTPLMATPGSTVRAEARAPKSSPSSARSRRRCRRGNQRRSVDGSRPATAASTRSQRDRPVRYPESRLRDRFGRRGKTTSCAGPPAEVLARGSKARLVAIDPENRELKDYYEGVLEPPTHDPAGIAQWLKTLLDVSMKEKASALIDTGGGDAALGSLIQRTDDMVKMMQDAGVEPVAIYPLSSRISDLSPLTTLEAAGFKPPATLIILNEGRADPTVPREQSFRRIMQHSAYRAAIDRGAIQLWMPRLYVAKEIEDRRTLQGSRDGIVPEGRKVVPLGVFDRSSVHKWLSRWRSSSRLFRPGSPDGGPTG